MYLCASIAQFPERRYRPALTCIRFRILILWESQLQVVRLPVVLTKLPSYSALYVELHPLGYGSSWVVKKPFIKKSRLVLTDESAKVIKSIIKEKTIFECKDSEYLLNLQKEIEKRDIFDKIFGYVGEYGYLCATFSIKVFNV